MKNIFTNKDLDTYIEKIGHINSDYCRLAQEKWDKVGKPLRSLGRLEDMVIQLAGITESINPKADKKAVVIFCSDNGVVSEGVTQTGQSVTAVVAQNFTKGIATVNSFAGVAGAKVIPVDVGINKDMSSVDGIINKKVAYGTKNMAIQAAMTKSECIEAIIVGIELVGNLKKDGFNMIITGEMGIGNTTTSSAVLSVLENIPVEKVTGRGAGLTKSGINHKIDVIKKAIAVNRPESSDVIDVLSKLGGFDICAITGAFLGGAIYHIPVIIDGFISAVAGFQKIVPIIYLHHMYRQNRQVKWHFLQSVKLPILMPVCVLAKEPVQFLQHSFLIMHLQLIMKLLILTRQLSGIIHYWINHRYIVLEMIVGS